MQKQKTKKQKKKKRKQKKETKTKQNFSTPKTNFSIPKFFFPPSEKSQRDFSIQEGFFVSDFKTFSNQKDVRCTTKFDFLSLNLRSGVVTSILVPKNRIFHSKFQKTTFFSKKRRFSSKKRNG